MSILVPFALALATASTQAGTEAIAACRNAHGGDPPAHIACLEDGLRARDDAVPGSPPQPPVPAPGTKPAAMPSAATPAVAPTTPAAQPAAAADRPPTGLGAEQARARARTDDEPPEQVSVRIVSVTYNYEGRGIFTMEDGQVWHETETSARYQRLATDRQYTASIQKGKIGGYRMYVDGVRRMIKLERIK